MNTACDICKGACCEFFTVTLDANAYTADWQSARGMVNCKTGMFSFDCPCPHFVIGQCGIYPKRPQACKDFLVGGVGCLIAIARQRTLEQQVTIKKAIDEQNMLPNKYRTGGGTITKR